MQNASGWAGVVGVGKEYELDQMHETRTHQLLSASGSQIRRVRDAKEQFMLASVHLKDDAGQELHHFFRAQVFLAAKMPRAAAFGKIRAPEEIECPPLIPPASPQSTP